MHCTAACQRVLRELRRARGRPRSRRAPRRRARRSTQCEAPSTVDTRAAALVHPRARARAARHEREREDDVGERSISPASVDRHNETISSDHLPSRAADGRSFFPARGRLLQQTASPRAPRRTAPHGARAAPPTAARDDGDEQQPPPADALSRNASHRSSSKKRAAAAPEDPAERRRQRRRRRGGGGGGGCGGDAAEDDGGQPVGGGFLEPSRTSRLHCLRGAAGSRPTAATAVPSNPIDSSSPSMRRTCTCAAHPRRSRVRDVATSTRHDAMPRSRRRARRAAPPSTRRLRRC